MIHMTQSDVAIKKVVIVGGLVLMLLCFTLVLVFNIDDTEDYEQIVAFSIAITGIVFFGSLLFMYIRSQLRKTRTQPNESDLERSNEIRERDIEPPPSYENFMGKPPSYDSCSKNSFKNIKIPDSECHV